MCIRDRRDTADAAVVVDQLDQNPTGQDTFRTISDEDVGGTGARAWHLQVGAQFGDQRGDLFGRADGRCRFEDDKIAGLQFGRDRASCCLLYTSRCV